jgi:hypothetical protein
MHFPVPDIIRKACLTTLLGLFLLIAAFSVAAQDKNRLPDSVSTAGDSIPPSDDRAAAKAAESSSSRDSVGLDNPMRDSVTQAADSVVLRAIPDSDIAKFKRDKDFAYANDPAYWMVDPPDKSQDGPLFRLEWLFGSKGFSYFIYALLIGLLLFALYRIISENNLHLFYKTPRKIKKSPGEGDETDLMDEDIDKLIREAMQAGNQRLTTRYLFLKALRLLDERELIRYETKATNEEYVRQLSGKEQGNSFRFLARAYEYVWYGGFALNESQYERLVDHFQGFYKTIKT